MVIIGWFYFSKTVFHSTGFIANRFLDFPLIQFFLHRFRKRLHLFLGNPSIKTMRAIYLLLCFLLVTAVAGAQEYWDLQKCVNYALEHNLEIKRTALAAKVSEQNLTQSKGANLPNLNAFANNFYNFGQTIDPFTNQFATQRVRSNSLGISANMNLFSGFGNYHTIKQREYEASASRYDVDKSRNDIQLAVAQAYLQILFAEELAEANRSQVAVTAKQVEQTKKMVEAGTVPQGSLFEVEAQLASEELTLTQSLNNIDLAYLNLFQLLQLEDDVEKFRIVKPSLEVQENEAVEATPGFVYTKALEVLPEVKGAEHRVMGADHQMKVAKSNYYPTLTLSGSLGSGYSGLNRTVISTATEEIVIGTTTSGQVVTTTVTNPTEFQTKSFGDQLSDNFNQSVGITLNIPIFNRFQVNTGVEQAKLSVETRELQYEQTKNTIRQTIEQAYADAVAALKSYKANIKAVKALRESFTYMQKRYDVGLINAVDLTDAKNRLTRAESDLLRAKYDYIFKQKILDFYQGKDLAF